MQTSFIIIDPFEGAFAGTTIFFTTRYGGQSRPPYGENNMGTLSGEDVHIVEKNKKKLCESVGIGADLLFVPEEKHTNKAVFIDQRFLSEDETTQSEKLAATDALYTTTKSVAIAVTTADCVPILAYSPQKQVCAAIHAGWRGLTNKIVEKTMEEIESMNLTTWEDTYFIIGPCIGGERYEIGPDVWEKFEHEFTDDERQQILKKKTDKKFYPDLSTATKMQICRHCGNNHVYETNINTYDDKRFYSVRRDGQPTGRFLSGIVMR